MTSEMRSSKYCNEEVRIVDGNTFYGCKEAIKSEPEEVRFFYECKLWDMELKESCKTCTLPCKNNANDAFQKTKEERRRLKNLIEELRPNMIMYGVSAGQIEEASKVYTKKGPDGEPNILGREGIKIAGDANKLLRMAVEGKHINPAYIGAYARRAIRAIKAMDEASKTPGLKDKKD